MHGVQVHMDDSANGSFFITRDETRVAEMTFRVSGNKMTVHHTEVSQPLEGQGLASALFSRMVSYAREQGLRVAPECRYVLARLQKDPDQYHDIWKGTVE